MSKAPSPQPHDRLPYDPDAAPRGPSGVDGWAACDDFLHRLSGYGVPAADRFVMEHRHLRYPDVRRFFGSIAPDPMLGARNDAREPRGELGLPDQMPSSLAHALREICQLPEEHASHELHALATYVQNALRIDEDSDAPILPPWANRTRIIQGQHAFMTRLLPSVLALVCKSLIEAYSAPRPASVLNLSGELTALPYHRLLGTLQLLVTVSTHRSFEGPWYPALVAAQEMQLLHAGVRMNVAPRLVTPKTGRIERDRRGWSGPDDFTLWGGYEAFREGWPYRAEGTPAVDPPQVAVSQTDMLATIIAFGLFVVDGVDALGAPFEPDDAEAYWHLWRVFAVLKGIHPPGRPDDGSWVPETLDEARAFWATYQRHYVVGPTARSGDWVEEAKRTNPSGYALTSAHLRMLARLLKVELRWIPVSEKGWLHVVRYYVERMCGEAGGARVGMPKARYGWMTRLLVETGPGLWSKIWSRTDVETHASISRRFLAGLIGQVYGDRVVFPVPQTADDLREFVEHTRRKRPGEIPVEPH